MSETKHKEIILYEGELADYFPYTGVIQNRETKRFLANWGYSLAFAPKEMSEKRWADARQAVIDGLAQASSEVGLRGIPQDMLAEIVKHRAIHATKENRDGTESAKFIFQIIGMAGDDHGKDRSGITIKMSDEMAEYAIRKLIDADA